MVNESDTIPYLQYSARDLAVSPRYRMVLMAGAEIR
jgi:hypothetical protein